MLLVAAEAVGAGWMGETRAAMAGFLVGLLATFLFVRINTRLIRAKVSWWFHDIESEGGTHVHHMVIGVILIVLKTVLIRKVDRTFAVGLVVLTVISALIMQVAPTPLWAGFASMPLG